MDSHVDFIFYIMAILIVIEYQTAIRPQVKPVLLPAPQNSTLPEQPATLHKCHCCLIWWTEEEGEEAVISISLWYIRKRLVKLE